MYLEYQAALEAAAEDYLSALAPQCSVKASVVKAPLDVGADVASNIAFEISSRFRAAEQPRLPMQVAQELLECFNHLEVSRYFSVSVGGDGYLNASPTTEFAVWFLEALKKDPQLLLRDKVFTTPREVVRDEGFLIPLVEFERVKAKLTQRGREDVLALLRTPSFEDLLMVFAACSNPELDLKAYIEGFNTSEAVPWYLGRASSDAQRFLTITCEKTSTAIARSVPKYGQTAFNRAAAFRGQTKVGDFRSNAVRLVGTLIGFAGGFYEFFNRPDCRTPSQLAGSDALTYRILSQALVETIDKGLELLRISCEDAGLVLEK
ncbi:MAG: hypothetical protein KDD66_11605 [Bdellovibrionales bacterium]|nr:hypothetical protein [Bdellovibrionales bacterium]